MASSRKPRQQWRHLIMAQTVGGERDVEQRVAELASSDIPAEGGARDRGE
jgi:hypothetical protein